MRIAVASSPPEQTRTPALVFGLAEGEELDPSLQALDRAFDGLLARLVREKVLRGKSDGEDVVHTLGRVPAERLVVIGLGKRRDLDLKRLFDWSARVARRLRKAGAADAALIVPVVDGAGAEALARVVVEGLALGAGDFHKHKSEAEAAGELGEVTLLAPDPAAATAYRKGVRRGEAVAAGMTLCRDLGNEPANVATPTFLAEAAREMAAQRGIACEVFGAERMTELGMGALLGVARGSDEPARFIVLDLPAAAGSPPLPPLALVGKGLTFDSGGISIKPAARMHEMKFDMCGGAAVIGALRALAELAPARRVIGLVPATENLPSGKAVKPGDVLRSMSGLTIEVTNTDAEGRLILADALTYARRYQPEAIIDIATLTGAIVIALGAHAIGLMGNDKGFNDHVQQAGATSGERVWPLPLYREYLEAMKSEVADLVNSSSAGGKAITAAAFLSRFAEGVKWAHLDIAGTAWAEGEGGGPKLVSGATGSGVRTMVEAVLSYPS